MYVLCYLFKYLITIYYMLSVSGLRKQRVNDLLK